MRVQRLAVAAPEVVDGFYDLYLAAFEPLRTLAAARHVLDEEEFNGEMADPRIDKYVAFDDTGRAVGLTTFTEVLSSVPWIEPQYFEAKYPDHAARNAIFYLGFTLVRPEARRARVFRTTLEPLIARSAEARAVVAFDICAHNDVVLGLSRGIQRSMGAVLDLEMRAVDTQTYYALEVFGLRQPA